MSQKFIDWENLAYVLEQLRKETIDHASLDEHLDAMWETREKVTNKMKYAYEDYTETEYNTPEITPHKSIVGINQHNLTQDQELAKMKYAYEDYTETDYNTPEITPHKSIVGINQHNLTQDGRLSAVEAKNEAQDDKLDGHDTTLGTHAETLTDHGGRLDGHDTTLGTHAETLTGYGGRLDDHDETLESHAETLTGYGERITSSEELLAELTATSIRPLATDADTERMLNEIFGDNSNDSNS